MSKKIILVDTSYLIFRSFYGYPQLNKKEIPTGALFGFAKTIMYLSRRFKSDHIIFAKDLPTKTWRHKLYDGYKAGRPELAEELKVQFPMIDEWIRMITPNVLSMDGFEADDIIKTVCDLSLLDDEKNEVLIYSSDRDLYQLFVYPNVRFIQNSDLFDVEMFSQKYGVTPFQWIDFKTYVGDNSDNLKGVDGVGPKTAAKLLQHGVDLDAIYSFINTGSNTHIHEFINLKPTHQKLIDKIVASVETIKHTQKLATLQFVDSLPISLETTIDLEKGRSVFETYNFTSLLKTLGPTQQDREDLSQSLF